jgi:copper chaperone NosL
VNSGRSGRALPALALLTGAVLAACRPSDGPQPIAWDREPCAHCRMLISEPRFAAQLQAEDGSHASFDDPGCLLAHLESRDAPIPVLWFHHLREERWITGDRVAFERVEWSPMGYGLGALDARAAGALSFDEAKTRVRELSGRQRAPR